MEKKKLLAGKLDKNIVMGLSWLIYVFGLVTFIIDFKTLDVEEKREFVSLFVCWAASCIFAVTFIVPAYVGVCSIIACIMSFMGKSFKVPGAYQIAKAIIK